MKKIILFQPWGGLGDNLQFSTIPEMAKRQGYTVYISSKNAYRNEEICELVWKNNPYIDGFSDEQPNAGSTDGITEDGISCKVDQARAILGVASFVYCYEYLHGFKPEHKNPKIYYKPNTIKEVADKTLFDLGTITLKNDYNIDKLVNFIKINYKDSNNFLLKHKNNYEINNSYKIESDKTIEFNNIFEYTDLIYSCKKFVCLWGGANALAAAIHEHSGKQTDVIVPNKKIYNQWQGFCFEPNQYLILE